MGLGVAGWESDARSEEPTRAASSTPASDVVFPVLLPHEPPPYPEGAHGDAEAILVLVVSSEGEVIAVDVEKGEPPFSEVAREAARRFRYRPATRAGKAVPAKVRVLITFHEPSLAPDPGSDAASSPAPSARPVPSITPPLLAPLPSVPTGPGAGASQEVRVAGVRREPGLTASFTRNEVREIPGSFGDPFRALEVMPGVTPIISGLPFFYVRGSPPGNVGYMLDGIRVPYLYHVGLGPSVIHPGIVDRVDLYGGGYPARYGRYAGGIVAAETTEPHFEPHAEWNVRLFDAGALAETGFAGDRGSIAVGGRYSYTAAVISLLAPRAVLDYRDYQLRATYRVSPADTLSVFSFGAYDLFGEKHTNGVLDVAFGAEFYRADVRWDHKLEDGGRVRTAVTLGYDRSLLGEDRVARTRSIASRFEVTKPASEEVTVRAGADVEFRAYDTELLGDSDSNESEQLARIFPTRNDVDAGLRVDMVYRPSRRFEVVPGLRGDLYTSGGVSAFGVDPRIATKVWLTEHVRLLQAHGIAAQPPSFVAPVPGLGIAGLAGGLQRAIQTSAGVEADLPLEFTGSATAFRNVTLHLTDFLTSAARFNDSDARLFDRRATGDAYGLEFFVRRPLTRRFSALASYTLSRATQREANVVSTGAYDRTHVLNVAGMLDLGKHWRFAAKFVTYSGNPQLFGSSDSPTGKVEDGRSDAFYRLDFRLEKRWILGPKRHISAILEVINTTLNKEHINDQAIGPITIPSLGVEGEL